jgi:hypothetical protein
MKTLIGGFLRPKVIFPIPAGQQGVDAAGANGLIGLMANANAYAESLSSIATTVGGATVIVPAQLLSGAIQLNAGATGAFNLTLPSTGSVISALPASIPLDGSYTERLTIVNQSAQVANVTPGDGGTTIVGATVIGSSTARTYLLRILGSSTMSLTNMGQLPL